MRPFDRTVGNWRLPIHRLTPRQDYPDVDQARTYLGLLIGQYCAFCEMQTNVLPDFKVEHALPHITTSRASELLLVCPDCSRHRHQFIIPTDTLDRFVSPEQDNSFDFFVYNFSPKHLEKDLIQPGLLSLLADTSLTPETRNRIYERVWVLPNPRYQDNPVLYEKIKQTIRVTGLNAVDLTGRDRRIDRRTQAWQDAVEFSTLLIGHYAEARTNPNNTAQNQRFLNGFVRHVGKLAHATGFWSVWMTVFLRADFGDPLLAQQLICDILIKPFPGTRFQLPDVNCTEQH